MEWSEWIDAMQKLGYSDQQTADFLRKNGYDEKAITKLFGPKLKKIAFFDPLLILDPEIYFDRLDTSEKRTPIALLLINSLLAGLLASYSFDISFFLLLIFSPLIAAVQIGTAHAGAKVLKGKGSLEETFFSQALSVSTQFFLLSIAFLFFAFFNIFSPFLAFSALLIVSWVAVMISAALGYPGMQRYHTLEFGPALISTLMLPILALLTAFLSFLLFTLYQFLFTL